MSIVNKPAADKDECHLTVLSQSFADAMPVYSTSNSFWDALVLQQQQLGQTHHTLNKPIGNISQDIHHEYNPDAALLAVSASQQLGIHDLITAPNLSLFMPCHQRSVIKDDVFLAQPSSHHVEIDDNASLSSLSTLSSFQPSVTSPYCLSPVSLPTHFLYNHEPLFEGGIIETDDRPVLDYDGGDEEYGDFSSAMTGSAMTGSASKHQEQRLSTSEDLDWLKLLDAFHADVASDILASSETAVGDDKDGPGLSDLASESGLDDVFSNDTVLGSTNNKRKRVTKAQSSTPAKAAVAKKPRQKRQRKIKLTVKRQLKMKEHEDNSVVVLNDAESIQKPTSSSDNNEYDDMDQNKEIQNYHQLTDSVMSDGNSTVFQQLTDANVDWCRYCGTTEGVNWRPGPWGKRTLCNKHGCDYKGYGLASRLPRLDLSSYMDEKIEDRIRPIVQEFCLVCQFPKQTDSNQLIHCQGGCSRAYHRLCRKPSITVNPSVRWYCGALCKENRKLKKVVVEIPRSYMPLMQSFPTKSKKKTTA